MDIHIHIERLVLDGLPVERRQRGVVQSALEAELARLLAGGGLSESLSAGVALPVLRAGHIQLAVPHDPAQIGGQIASAVYSGLGSAEGMIA
jgi:hypothetical protein